MKSSMPDRPKDMTLPLYFKGFSKNFKKITSLFLIVFFVSFNSSAQTFPADCPSKDLELLSAALPPPSNDPCACGGTRELKIGIINKTGSTRTSFAMWGTLIRRNAEGIQVDANGTPTNVGENIFACAGPVAKNATSVLPTGKMINFTCGQSLQIINLHLAWTSASPGETCANLEAHPELIAPKCGTRPEINVDLGVNGNLNSSNASCAANDGSITVLPYGGKPNYSVACTGKTTQTGIVAGGTATFSALTPGNYTIVVTDANGCTASIQKTIGGSSIPTPSATVTAQPNCTTATGTVTVTSADANTTYRLKQGSDVKYTATNGIFSGVATGTYTLFAEKGQCTNTGGNVTVNAKPLTPSFTVCLVQPTLCANTGSVTITASGGSGFTYKLNGSTVNSNVISNLGSGSVTSITVTNSDNCFTTVNCADLVELCPTEKLSSARLTTNSYQLAEEQPKVLAYPNPFNGKVKFVVSSPIPGKGSLEVFNMLGQKVKTIYQGNIASGTQSFELSLPRQNLGNLIYVLRIGDKRLTGKLIQLK